MNFKSVLENNKLGVGIVAACLVIGVLSIFAIVSLLFPNKGSNDALVTPTPTLEVTQTTTPTTTPTESTSVTPTATTSVTPSVTNPPQSLKYFENQFMKIRVTDGWTASGLNTGAVNITNGKYILYINPNTAQVSGIQGGRFSEISGGAPSADAVITVQPSGPCGTTAKSAAFAQYLRFDLYINNKETASYCASPSDGSTVWYFSYVGDGTSYFNYYSTEPMKGYVITMSYNSKDVKSFPKKDSAELNGRLTEMTTMIKSFELKK